MHRTVAVAPPSRTIMGAGLGLTQLIAFGTSLYLLTILSEPIRVSTGWGLPWITGGLSIGVLAGSVISPLVGRRIGRGQARQVLSLSSLCFAAGLTIIGLSSGLPIYIAGWILVGLGMASGLYDAVFSALGRFYGREARPIISSVALLGGFASTVFWVLSGALVELVGWRGTCFVYAGIHVLVALPLYRVLLPRSGRVAGEPATAPSVEGLAEDAAPRPVVVWLTAGIFMVEALVATTVGVHLVNLLLAQGLTTTAAIGAAALIGPAQVAARFAEMSAGSRFHPVLTTTGALIAICLGLAILAVWPGAVVPAIIMYGAGIGVFSIARGTLPLAIFGPGQYPVIMGRIARPIAITQAIAPTLGAFLVASMAPAHAFAVIALVALCCVFAALSLKVLASRVHQA